jgi:hypothetical protein
MCQIKRLRLRPASGLHPKDAMYQPLMKHLDLGSADPGDGIADQVVNERICCRIQSRHADLALQLRLADERPAGRLGAFGIG